MLKGLSCTDESECGPHFDAVKKELLIEFPWVAPVYTFGDNLFAPFQQAAGASYFDVEQVTRDIRNSLPTVSDSSNVNMSWVSIMADLMYIASGVASVADLEGSSVFGLIGSAGNLATDTMEQPDSNGGPAEKVITKAGQLADQMAQQQTAYAQWVGQMERILLYDYGKLSAVGAAFGNQPGWTWQTGITTTEAVTALQANATAAAYSALLPVAWSGYNLTPVEQSSSNDVTTLQCGSGPKYHAALPFSGALPQNQFHAVTSIAGDGSAVDRVWLFTNLDLGLWSANNASPRQAQVPTESLTDLIYGPYATTGHTKKGIFYYGAYQYEPVWWRDTYNPPAHVICAPASTDATSVAYPPPRIAPPPA
jgi:hypothetical protein